MPVEMKISGNVEDGFKEMSNPLDVDWVGKLKISPTYAPDNSNDLKVQLSRFDDYDPIIISADSLSNKTIDSMKGVFNVATAEEFAEILQVIVHQLMESNAYSGAQFENIPMPNIIVLGKGLREGPMAIDNCIVFPTSTLFELGETHSNGTLSLDLNEVVAIMTHELIHIGQHARGLNMYRLAAEMHGDAVRTVMDNAGFDPKAFKKVLNKLDSGGFKLEYLSIDERAATSRIQQRMRHDEGNVIESTMAVGFPKPQETQYEKIFKNNQSVDISILSKIPGLSNRNLFELAKTVGFKTELLDLKDKVANKISISIYEEIAKRASELPVDPESPISVELLKLYFLQGYSYIPELQNKANIQLVKVTNTILESHDFDDRFIEKLGALGRNMDVSFPELGSRDLELINCFTPNLDRNSFIKTQDAIESSSTLELYKEFPEFFIEALGEGYYLNHLQALSKESLTKLIDFLLEKLCSGFSQEFERESSLLQKVVEKLGLSSDEFIEAFSTYLNKFSSINKSTIETLKHIVKGVEAYFGINLDLQLSPYLENLKFNLSSFESYVKADLQYVSPSRSEIGTVNADVIYCSHFLSNLVVRLESSADAIIEFIRDNPENAKQFYPTFLKYLQEKSLPPIFEIFFLTQLSQMTSVSGQDHAKNIEKIREVEHNIDWQSMSYESLRGYINTITKGKLTIEYYMSRAVGEGTRGSRSSFDVDITINALPNLFRTFTNKESEYFESLEELSPIEIINKYIKNEWVSLGISDDLDIEIAINPLAYDAINNTRNISYTGTGNKESQFNYRHNNHIISLLNKKIREFKFQSSEDYENLNVMISTVLSSLRNKSESVKWYSRLYDNLILNTQIEFSKKLELLNNFKADTYYYIQLSNYAKTLSNFELIKTNLKDVDQQVFFQSMFQIQAGHIGLEGLDLDDLLYTASDSKQNLTPFIRLFLSQIDSEDEIIWTDNKVDIKSKDPFPIVTIDQLINSIKGLNDDQKIGLVYSKILRTDLNDQKRTQLSENLIKSLDIKELWLKESIQAFITQAPKEQLAEIFSSALGPRLFKNLTGTKDLTEADIVRFASQYENDRTFTVIDDQLKESRLLTHVELSDLLKAEQFGELPKDLKQQDLATKETLLIRHFSEVLGNILPEKTNDPKTESSNQKGSVMLIDSIQKVGGLAVKLMQISGQLVPISDPQLKEKLKTTYDQNPGLPISLIWMNLSEYLQKDPLNFSWINDLEILEILGSGSLLTSAKVKINGEIKVLQIVQPNTLDFSIEQKETLLNVLQDKKVRKYPLSKTLKVLLPTTLNWIKGELDDKETAAKISRFSNENMLKNSGEYKEFNLPNTDKTVVILQDFVAGTSLNKLEDGSKVKNDAISIYINHFESWFNSDTKENRLFHPDPHFGNIFYDQESGEMSMIDKRYLLEYSPTERQIFAKLWNGDYLSFISDFTKLVSGEKINSVKLSLLRQGLSFSNRESLGLISKLRIKYDAGQFNASLDNSNIANEVMPYFLKAFIDAGIDIPIKYVLMLRTIIYLNSLKN